MTTVDETDLPRCVQAWDEGAWLLAAVALDARADSAPQLRAAAQAVLEAAGLVETPGEGLRGVEPAMRQRFGAQAAAPLHLTSALVSDGKAEWSANSGEALRAQGEASAQGAAMFAKFMLPTMGDLAARLNAPGGRMLDVGTGVAALAVAFAEVFPHLEVLGIDVMDRALQLAGETISAASVRGRVSVRKQSVADFDDADSFDLAWIPAPFVPEPALRQGLPRVVATLRPGGLVMVGHGKFGTDPVADALTRFKTTAYGGTALDEQTAQRLLHEQGLAAIRSVPTPPGAPAITIGSAPSAGQPET